LGDAYTPGLTVTGQAMVRKLRRLPLPGTVVVSVGQTVRAADVVARTELPGKVTLMNFANLLGVLPDELPGTLRVAEGDRIARKQLLAEHRGFFGLSRSTVESPIDGVLESVSRVTGQAVLREPPQPVEVMAYMDGIVVEEIPHEGVVVETRAALIQGIFGLAGERHAPLTMVSQQPGQRLDAADVRLGHAGQILVGGGLLTLAGMRKAIEVGAAGVVAGGFAYQDVRELLGFDVGVAVTGTEALPTTLVVTEGFGDIAMARATFELLRRFDGAVASINGATQIRAGVIRPEVVIPNQQAAEGAVDGPSGLEVGAPVRCIRAPYFGRIGTVVDLPVELREMPSETMVRVLEIELEGGQRAVLPRANVEVIER
jgi:hypothetical protein